MRIADSNRRRAAQEGSHVLHSRVLSRLILALCLFGACDNVLAQTWKPTRLWITGGDQSVWVIGASAPQATQESGSRTGPSLPIVHIWCGQKTGDSLTPRANQYLPPISGDPVAIAADTEALHVLFSNLSLCDYFTSRPYSPGASWSEQCRAQPVAWAGDSGSTGLWALVASDDLRNSTPSSEPTDEPLFRQEVKSRYALLSLREGVWRRYETDARIEKAKDLWMAVRGGRPAVFWRDGDSVYCMKRILGEWTSPRALPLHEPFHDAWAGAGADGYVFIAGLHESSGQVELHLFQEKNEEWTSLGAAREGNELLTISPKNCGVGIARNQLCVARPRGNDEVEFGTAAIGPAPAVRLVPLTSLPEFNAVKSRWEDALTLGLLLGIMTIALWSRREEAVRVIVLSPGWTLTPAWKRAIAGAIDFIPAVVITSPWWAAKLAPMMNDYGIFWAPDQSLALEQIRLEWYGTIVCYGLWCCIWEAIMGRSPGKLLLGCRVVSLDGTPPTLRQCVIRNAVRTLMVALGLGGLLVTLMTITVVTRNRQRLGDLLARTLVVEPGTPPINLPDE
ncbi:MAG TPA: RDD family protein [Phycisphaerae bacterium]|nr:RDD family protein [Phycisphaerae bacterium]